MAESARLPRKSPRPVQRSCDRSDLSASRNLGPLGKSWRLQPCVPTTRCQPFAPTALQTLDMSSSRLCIPLLSGVTEDQQTRSSGTALVQPNCQLRRFWTSCTSGSLSFRRWCSPTVKVTGVVSSSPPDSIPSGFCATHRPIVYLSCYPAATRQGYVGNACPSQAARPFTLLTTSQCCWLHKVSQYY